MKQVVAVLVTLGLLATSVRGEAQPDYQIKNVKATVNDRAVTLTGEVCNNGAIKCATSVGLGYYPDKATKPACNDPHLNGVGIGGLAPSKCSNVTETFVNRPVGTTTGWIYANYTCTCSESNLSDNAAGASYTIQPPELYLKSFTVSKIQKEQFYSTWEATYTAVVCNKGSSVLKTTSVGNALFHNHPTKPICKETPTKSVGGGGQQAGSCMTISFYVDNLKKGTTITSWFAADSWCGLPDADRNDNFKSVTFYVGPQPDGGPPDVGVPDAGPADAGPADAGVFDASTTPCNLNGKCDPGEACPCTDCCTCESSNTYSYTRELKVSLDDSFKCPVVGGKMGYEAIVGASITGEATGCPTCQSSDEFSAAIAITSNLCKGRSWTFTGQGKYKVAKQYCLECDKQTCKKKCGSEHCTTESFSGQLGVGVSNYYGLQFDKSFGGGKFGLTAHCGVTLTGKIGASGTYEDAEGGCQPCKQCEKTGFELLAGIDGAGGCGVTFALGKRKETYGCEECATAGVEVAGGLDWTKGDCGNKKCAKMKITAKGGFNGNVCMKMLWWGVTLGCAVSAEGTCEGNTCGGSGCKTPKLGLQCAVGYQRSCP